MVVERIALDDQNAQTMAEYAVLLSVITVALVTTVSLLSDAVVELFQRTLEALS